MAGSDYGGSVYLDNRLSDTTDHILGHETDELRVHLYKCQSFDITVCNHEYTHHDILTKLLKRGHKYTVSFTLSDGMPDMRIDEYIYAATGARLELEYKKAETEITLFWYDPEYAVAYDDSECVPHDVPYVQFCRVKTPHHVWHGFHGYMLGASMGGRVGAERRTAFAVGKMRELFEDFNPSKGGEDGR